MRAQFKYRSYGQRDKNLTKSWGRITLVVAQNMLSGGERSGSDSHKCLAP